VLSERTFWKYVWEIIAFIPQRNNDTPSRKDGKGKGTIRGGRIIEKGEGLQVSAEVQRRENEMSSTLPKTMKMGGSNPSLWQ